MFRVLSSNRILLRSLVRRGYVSLPSREVGEEIQLFKKLSNGSLELTKKYQMKFPSEERLELSPFPSNEEAKIVFDNQEYTYTIDPAVEESYLLETMIAPFKDPDEIFLEFKIRMATILEKNVDDEVSLKVRQEAMESELFEAAMKEKSDFIKDSLARNEEATRNTIKSVEIKSQSKMFIPWYNALIAGLQDEVRLILLSPSSPGNERKV